MKVLQPHSTLCIVLYHSSCSGLMDKSGLENAGRGKTEDENRFVAFKDANLFFLLTMQFCGFLSLKAMTLKPFYEVWMTTGSLSD